MYWKKYMILSASLKIDMDCFPNHRYNTFRNCLGERIRISHSSYSLIHKIVSRIVVFEDRLRVEFNRDGVMKLLQEAGMEAVNE